MAYIGRGTDKISNVEVLDNITFDGSSSYTLQKSSVNFTPSSANTLLLSIDGVVQAGNFTVSGSTIDFGTAVAGTSTCDFVLHYGVGLITAPSDGTVTTAKLADDAVTSAKLAPLTDKLQLTRARNNTLGNPALEILPSDTVVGYGFRMESSNNDLVFEKSAPSGSEAELLRFKASGGIALGGTGTANTLDDYEKGTYTAGIFDANSGGNQSATTETGYYTKIGRLVNFNVAFADINTTGLTGSNRIFVSLPFASINGQTDAQTAPFVKKFSFGGYLIFGESSGSQKSRFGFVSINNAASQTSTTVSDVTDDDNYCSVSLTYITDD